MFLGDADFVVSSKFHQSGPQLPGPGGAAQRRRALRGAAGPLRHWLQGIQGR